jgi:hypothetical protein
MFEPANSRTNSPRSPTPVVACESPFVWLIRWPMLSAGMGVIFGYGLWGPVESASGAAWAPDSHAAVPVPRARPPPPAPPPRPPRPPRPPASATPASAPGPDARGADARAMAAFAAGAGAREADGSGGDGMLARAGDGLRWLARRVGGSSVAAAVLRETFVATAYHFNPHLRPAQLTELGRMFDRLYRDWRQGRRPTRSWSQTLRPLLALAVPNGDHMADFLAAIELVMAPDARAIPAKAPSGKPHAVREPLSLDLRPHRREQTLAKRNDESASGECEQHGDRHAGADDSFPESYFPDGGIFRRHARKSPPPSPPVSAVAAPGVPAPCPAGAGISSPVDGKAMASASDLGASRAAAHGISSPVDGKATAFDSDLGAARAAASRISSPVDGKATASDSDLGVRLSSMVDGETAITDSDLASVCGRYGCDPATLRLIGRADRPPVLAALRIALESDPCCCISLEDLLGHDGRLVRGVTAIVQKVRGTWHAFLYQHAALQRWLDAGGAMNPANRAAINLSHDLLRLS